MLKCISSLHIMELLLFNLAFRRNVLIYSGFSLFATSCLAILIAFLLSAIKSSNYFLLYGVIFPSGYIYAKSS
jgi:hypothetical protein